MAVEEYPFSKLLSLVIDNRGKSCPTADSGIPLIATNCIRNEMLYPNYDKVRFVSKETYGNWFRGHPLPGDIIFVNKATPGRVCLVPDPVDFCIAQDMVAVRADPNRIYPKYLFAVLRSPATQEKIAQMHVGTLIPHFKKGDFDKLLLPIPERSAQEFIGDAYFALSAKIDSNRRMNATLEAMARALFDNWVQSHANGIEERIVQELIDDAVLLIGDGYRAKNSEFTDDGLPFIRAGNVKADGLDLAGAEILSACSTAAAGRKVGKVGDVAFTSKGTVGRITRVSPKTGAFVYSPQVCFWRSLAPDTLNPNVLYRWMSSDDFRRQVAAVSTQTDMAPYVSLQDQRKMVIQLPRSAAQQEIAKRLEPIDDLIASNAEQSRTLAALRDTLLPKLLSGDLSPNINQNL